MIRRLFAMTAIVVVALVATAGAAFAHNCVNLSRNPGNAPFEEKGPWTYIPPGVIPLDDGAWVFGNPEGFGGNSGHAPVLLDGTGACNTNRLRGQTQGSFNPNDAKGIWSEECFIAASPA